MGWFSKPYNPIKALEKISELMVIVNQRLCDLEIEVEGIRTRFRKRIIPATKEESDGKEPDKLPSDGFDNLRKLNKDHGTQF